MKIIETGGQTLRTQLVRTDLSGCLMSDCNLCKSGAGGGHTPGEVVSTAGPSRCTLEYFGEYDRSGYHQMKEHARDIRTNNIKNAFNKHLKSDYHQG